MEKTNEIIKILCRQILLNRYIKIDELRNIFQDFQKNNKIKNNFKDIINTIRRKLEDIGLNVEKITDLGEDFVVITIPFDSEYIKKGRLDEISLSLLSIIINLIETRGGEIPQSELETAFGKYISTLKYFVSLNYLKLIEVEGKFEKNYIITPLAKAIILTAQNKLKEILKDIKIK
jgi:hypothetical protein